MSGALEGFARKVWDADGGYGAVGVLLRPASWAYAALVGLHGRLRGWSGEIRPEGVRVVSVGNLAVGGTGKTPLTAWVVDVLNAAGLTTSIVCRGYGADEIALHEAWHPDTPVIVNPDRVAGVMEAGRRGVGAVVLDDGFQHRRLGRDLDIVLLAAEDSFPGPLLPAGPYREGPGALRRADIVLITRKTATYDVARSVAERARAFAPEAVFGHVHLRAAGWSTLDGAPAAVPDAPVLAVAGVARPEAFWDMVAWETGQEVELLAFSDHHSYDRADVDNILGAARDRFIATTEKDRMKLERFQDDLPHVRVLRQEVFWEDGENEVASLVRRAGAAE